MKQSHEVMQLLSSGDCLVIQQVSDNSQRRLRIAKTPSLYLFFISILLISCNNNPKSANTEVQETENLVTVVTNKEVAKIKPTKISDIPIPSGFARIESLDNSFTNYLRNLPLDTIDDVVHLYNGAAKGNQNVHYAIIKMDVGKRDLQQCADAVMRLRGEHLYKEKKYDEISFLFTNGDRVDFNKYAQGYRPSINGNRVNWSKTQEESYSYTTFRKYMDLIFTYAGTLSLTKQLNSVPNFDDIQSGDVIIIGGSPGHAVIVVDIAINESTNEKIFMIAQSYMPAQEIHVLKNMDNQDLSPWYRIPEGTSVVTPEYYFEKDNLMRF